MRSRKKKKVKLEEWELPLHMDRPAGFGSGAPGQPNGHFAAPDSLAARAADLLGAAGPNSGQAQQKEKSAKPDLPPGIDEDLDPHLMAVVQRAWREFQKSGELTLQANRYLLVGDDGKLRGMMSCEGDNVGLSMFDGAGNLKVRLAIIGGLPALDMYCEVDPASQSSESVDPAPSFPTEEPANGDSVPPQAAITSSPADSEARPDPGVRTDSKAPATPNSQPPKNSATPRGKRRMVPRISLACVRLSEREPDPTPSDDCEVRSPKPGARGSASMPMLSLCDMNGRTQVSLGAEPRGLSWLAFCNGDSVPIASFDSEYGVVPPLGALSGIGLVGLVEQLRAGAPPRLSALLEAERILRLVRSSCGIPPSRMLAALETVYYDLLL
ncbi:MAG TPA: hypothetical protein VI756_10815 [Blastocatellia bacterium]